MPRSPGHDSGHPGFIWAEYVDWMIATTGSLAAVADRLSARRGHRDDVGSVERALRRLRKRGSRDGGTWGQRALAVYGLPDAAHQMVRWLGQYHARFTDLPRAMRADLLRTWDRPPTSESSIGRAWLALGHASLAVAATEHPAALELLDRVRGDLVHAPPAARLEAILDRAYVASRADPEQVPVLLGPVPELLTAVDDADDRACLDARHADFLAFELNRAADHAAARALYDALPIDGPPFARARRASGLAYAHWKLGALTTARDHAIAAADHAGDGGHVRARAMALGLLARITGDDEPRRRAIAIAHQLDDETLRLRLASHAQ